MKISTSGRWRRTPPCWIIKPGIWRCLQPKSVQKARNPEARCAEYAYSLDNFLYKYIGRRREDAVCLDFFSPENYVALDTVFDTTNTDTYDKRCLLAGVCTRIGEE